MVKVEYDVPIRRPPEAVFDFVTDVERIPDWQHEAGVRNVAKATPAALAVGSRFTMERTANRRTATIDATVTRLDPGREFDFTTVDSDGFKGAFRTTLTPTADGTNLHWSVRMEPPNLLYRILQPVIARTIRRSADLDFANLRRILEQGG